MKLNSVKLTQIIGILVIALAMFGIDVDAETQASIIAGLSSLGLVLTAIVDEIKERKSSEAV